MSEENKTVTPLDTLSIERNKTTVSFVSAEKKRGEKAGEQYYAIDPTVSLTTLLAYISEEDAKNMLLARVNILAQKWMKEASTKEDGSPQPFDVEEFKKYAQEFSARGLTSQELVDEIARVTTEITTLAMNPEFNAKPADERLAIMKAKCERVQELQAAVAKRKRKKDDENEATTN